MNVKYLTCLLIVVVLISGCIETVVRENIAESENVNGGQLLTIEGQSGTQSYTREDINLMEGPFRYAANKKQAMHDVDF